MIVSTLVALTTLQVPAIKINLMRSVPGISPIAMAPIPLSSRFAASLENSTIRIIDASTRQTLRELKGHPQPAYAIAVNPAGTMMASGDESGRIFFWNLKTGQKIREVRTHTRGVQNLDFNHVGTWLVSTGKDDTMRYYEAATGREIKVIYGKGANFYGARFVKGTNNVAVGTLGQGAWLFAGFNRGRTINAHADKNILDVDLKGNTFITAGKDGNAIVYDFKSGAKRQFLRGHADWVVRCTFSPNGRLAATSSSDATVRVWDMKSLQSVAKLDDQYMVGSPLTFTADGKYLLTAGNDNFLRIYWVTPPQK